MDIDMAKSAPPSSMAKSAAGGLRPGSTWPESPSSLRSMPCPSAKAQVHMSQDSHLRTDGSEKGYVEWGAVMWGHAVSVTGFCHCLPMRQSRAARLTLQDIVQVQERLLVIKLIVKVSLRRCL